MKSVEKDVLVMFILLDATFAYSITLGWGNHWPYNEEAQDTAAAPNEDGGVPEVMPGAGGADPEAGGAAGPKVRKDFPETLYYNPSLITDPSGKASVTLDMADSITEWRISTLANTADGVVGSTTGAITVFKTSSSM